ncbi:MAG TPA: heparan-alpha-glucosaminide N-acetyltransferase domain-containing protein [Luteitalea sp.]|nr:heparan-alpha-glucosaminide N-acetyltransferase domain-containing protein [Luteitalea sp.]
MTTDMRATSRLVAIDALRGLVMVVMALDHVRDFVHVGAMTFSPEDLARTTPPLFFTRWVTHVCAPAFVLLAGIAVYLKLRRDGSRSRLSAFLVSRGLWLIVAEVVLLRFALNFRLFGPDAIFLLVLWAVGVSMIVLAALIHLPPRVVGLLGVVIVVLHNRLDPIRAVDLGALAPLWTVLHQQGAIPIAGTVAVVGYPVLPWIGLLAVGFGAGQLFDLDARRRQRWLTGTGLALIVAFVALRWINQYGDPQPWASQATPLMTLVSFLRTTKYPPSLLFLLMTVGPVLLGLAWFDRRKLAPGHPLAVIGRVPLFYYLGHFLLAHVVASCLAWWTYGGFGRFFLSGPFPSMGGPAQAFPADFGWSLGTVYVVWLLVVALMYPLCRWFDGVKRRRRDWWLSYL